MKRLSEKTDCIRKENAVIQVEVFIEFGIFCCIIRGGKAMKNKFKDIVLKFTGKSLEKIKQKCMDDSETIIFSTDKGTYCAGERDKVLNMLCNIITQVKSDYPEDLIAGEIYKALDKTEPGRGSRRRKKIIGRRELLDKPESKYLS